MAFNRGKLGGINTAEYQVFKKKLSSLADQCQYSITSLASGLYSNYLINDELNERSLNGNQSQRQRVTEILNYVLEKIKADRSAFDKFTEVLADSEPRLAQALQEEVLQFSIQTPVQEITPASHSFSSTSNHKPFVKLTGFPPVKAIGIIIVIAIFCGFMYYIGGRDSTGKQANFNDVQEQSPTAKSLDSKPSIADMDLLQIGDKKLRVVERVGSDCNRLGYQLGLRDEMVTGIWYSKDSVREKCEKIIRKWIAGPGSDARVTWRTFIKAVENIDLNELARELRQMLSASN